MSKRDVTVIVKFDKQLDAFKVRVTSETADFMQYVADVHQISAAIDTGMEKINDLIRA